MTIQISSIPYGGGSASGLALEATLSALNAKLVQQTLGLGEDAVGIAVNLGTTQNNQISWIATIKNNTAPQLVSNGGSYIRQDSNATIMKESGGNAASIAISNASILADQVTPLSLFKTIALSNLLLTGLAGARLKRMIVQSTLAAAQYIQLHNTTLEAAEGAAPFLTFVIKANETLIIDFGEGISFSNGLSICNSTTAATKTKGAANCIFILETTNNIAP
jgi:hypothetical protein